MSAVAYVSTLETIVSLSEVLHLQERDAIAEPLLAEALAGARRSLPLPHPVTGSLSLNHGVCLTAIARLAQAEEALLAARETLEKTFGADHRETIAAIEALVAL